MSSPQQLPADLVQQLVATADWPAPELLRAILAHGEASVEPLRDALRNDKEALAVDEIVKLLSALNASQAIPDVIDLYYRFAEWEVLDVLIPSVAAFGASIVDPLLRVSSDSALDVYTRALAASALIIAAATDVSARQRVITTFRAELAQLLSKGAEADEDGIYHADTIANRLIKLQDRESEPLLTQVQAMGWISYFGETPPMIAQLFETSWAKPDEPLPANWLDEYEAHHNQKRLGWLEKITKASAGSRVMRELCGIDSLTALQTAPSDVLQKISIELDRQSAAEALRLHTLRNAHGKVGRNDPCPCGSGKKHKHCCLKTA